MTEPIRFGVLDIGSNSAHLRIADLQPGLAPEPVASVKHTVRLAEATDARGVIAPSAISRLIEAVRVAVAAAGDRGVGELAAYATSAVRDAANRDDVAAQVRAATGIPLGFIDGEEEARLTFLAARRWYGWSAGPLLVADIGGGSAELAYGAGRCPDAAVSLPLGAGRLTRHHLPAAAPVGKKQLARLGEHVREVLNDGTAGIRRRPAPRTALGTSKTLTQLARLCGAPAGKAGPYAARTLGQGALAGWIPELAARSDSQRAKLRGVKASRAHQILAGAVVADAIMDVLGIGWLDICPWALREGIFLDRLDEMEGRRRAGTSAPAGGLRLAWAADGGS